MINSDKTEVGQALESVRRIKEFEEWLSQKFEDIDHTPMALGNSPSKRSNRNDIEFNLIEIIYDKFKSIIHRETL